MNAGAGYMFDREREFDPGGGRIFVESRISFYTLDAGAGYMFDREREFDPEGGRIFVEKRSFRIFDPEGGRMEIN